MSLLDSFHNLLFWGVEMNHTTNDKNHQRDFFQDVVSALQMSRMELVPEYAVDRDGDSQLRGGIGLREHRNQAE